MRLVLFDFGNHDDTELDIDDIGITIFTGENGAGKSMIGEAIVWCLWGDTIRSPRRGWSPIRPGTSVSLELQGAEYKRVATGSGTKFTIDGKGSTSDNNRQIESMFGPSRLYQSTRVFHRSLLVKFSNATDSERKALMEFLLGSSDFDQCLKEAKADRKTYLDKQSEYERLKASCRAKIAHEEGFLKGLKRPVKPKKTKAIKQAYSLLNRRPQDPPPTPDDTNLYEARSKLARCVHTIEVFENGIAEAKALIKAGKCPVCGTSTAKRYELVNFPQMQLKQVKAEREVLADEVVKLKEEYKARVDKYEKARTEVMEFNSELAVAQEVVRQYEREFSRWQHDSADYDQALHHTREELAFKRQFLSFVSTKLMGVDAKLRRLDDLIQIYGPRGARVTLLQDAFYRVSTVATHVSQKLYDKRLYVEVRPDESMETVSLYITLPEGNEISYRGLSEGERSLIDFSLLKALSAVPTTTLGTGRLPFIYDDVMDAMDAGNAGRLARFLRAEAKEDGVVVFSHNPGLAEMFPDATCYEVQDGKVR